MDSTAARVDVLQRNNVRVIGNPAGPPIMFAHGFGCSQAVWRDVVPHFVDEFRVILFDHVGAGESDLAAYDRSKYDSLDGYAADVLEILEALDLRDVVFVGHSVSAMIGVLASNRDSSRVSTLVLVGPSPRYVNTGTYIGGFEQADIDGLLDALDSNYLGWSAMMAPVIMGNPDRPELGKQLVQTFCEIEPSIARHFAHVTFLSDNRDDLRDVAVPTLVVQCTDDAIAPLEVGEFVHAEIAHSTLVVIPALGHVPSLSSPGALVDAIHNYLR